MTLSMVNLALYRYAQAEQHAARGRELAVKSGGFWIEILGGLQAGVVALQVGRVADAVTALESAMEQVQAANLGLFMSLGAPWLAMAYAAGGEVERARKLIEPYLADPALERMAELNLMTGHAHGRILAAAGDPAGAEAALTEALAVAQQAGNVFFQMETRGALGRLCRDQGRAGDAATHFGEVLQLGEEAAATIDDPVMREAYLAAPPFATARGGLVSQGNTSLN